MDAKPELWKKTGFYRIQLLNFATCLLVFIFWFFCNNNELVLEQYNHERTFFLENFLQVGNFSALGILDVKQLASKIQYCEICQICGKILFVASIPSLCVDQTVLYEDFLNEIS